MARRAASSRSFGLCSSRRLSPISQLGVAHPGDPWDRWRGEKRTNPLNPVAQSFPDRPVRMEAHSSSRNRWHRSTVPFVSGAGVVPPVPFGLRARSTSRSRHRREHLRGGHPTMMADGPPASGAPVRALTRILATVRRAQSGSGRPPQINRPTNRGTGSRMSA